MAAPILLLTTARHELFETRAEWAEGHEAEQVILDPLSAEDSEAIVAAAPGRSRASRPTSGSCSAAEGNPLYVEQITAMLVETRRHPARRRSLGRDRLVG